MPALSVAFNQGDLIQAVDYARTMLDLTQKRLEADLTQALVQSVEACEAGRFEETRQFLHHTLELAMKYTYI
jgi:hypothetical protein